MICRLELLPAFLTEDFTNVDRIMGIPLKHKGLDIPSPSIKNGGAKYKHTFYLPDSDDFGDQKSLRAVDIFFEDVMVEGKIDKIKKTSKYYGIDNDGNEIVFCEKVEHEIIRDSASLLRKRYDRAYTYLKESAKGTPIEPYVIAILNHYAQNVSIWLLGSPQSFIDAIDNETDTTILAYLDIVIHESGKKVIHAIKEQLTGVTWTP